MRVWRGGVWMAAFLLVVLVGFPWVTGGTATTIERWRSWRARAAVETHDPTPVYPNQSFLSAMKRLLTAEGGARDPLHYAVASWPPARVVDVFYTVVAGAAIPLAVAVRRHPPGLPGP